MRTLFCAPAHRPRAQVEVKRHSVYLPEGALCFECNKPVNSGQHFFKVFNVGTEVCEYQRPPPGDVVSPRATAQYPEWVHQSCEESYEKRRQAPGSSRNLKAFHV